VFNNEGTEPMSEFQEIKNFVMDHWDHFGCYPMEVETKESVYTFDQYWAILDNETTKEPNR
jgi:hypothetical protein